MVAKAVGGGRCRLRVPLKLAVAIRETVAGHRLGTLEGWGVTPPFQSIPGQPSTTASTTDHSQTLLKPAADRLDLRMCCVTCGQPGQSAVQSDSTACLGCTVQPQPHTGAEYPMNQTHPASPPPAPLCDIPSGCCSFTGPWTVTRSSLHMLCRVAVSVGRCGRCSCWCRFRVRGAQ